MQAAQENQIVRALRAMLAGSRNPLHDGVGFNRFHRPVAEECLKKIESRGLDPTMARMLVDRVLPHYRRQLDGLGFEFDAFERAVPTVAPKTPGTGTVLGTVGAPTKPRQKTFEFGRRTDERGDWLTIRFPERDQTAVEAIKAIPADLRAYDPSTYTWLVRHAACLALAPKLREAGYEVSGLASAGAGAAAAKVTEVEGELARAVMQKYAAMRERGEIDWGFYDHQKVGIAWMMARDGCLNCDDMGLGKEQPVDSMVATPLGYRRMGDLKVGDEVIGRDGNPTGVVGVYPQGVKAVYRVTFSDGYSVEVGLEHLWAVNTPTRNKRGNPHLVKTTAEIMADLKDRSGNNKWFVPMVQPVRYPERDLPVEPYLLGVLLGDGGFSQACHSLTTDNEIVASTGLVVSGAARHQQNRGSYTGQYRLAGAYTTEVKPELVKLGLHGKRAESKFIPAEYLIASFEQRLALFRGLMDTDGWCGGPGALEYTSASERLADQVVELVQSFGGAARKAVKPEPRYTYRGERRTGQPSYRVNITLPAGIAPFRLARKAANYTKPTKYGPSRGIVSIEYSRDAEAQCIAVDAPDHLYVTEHYIVTHNTIQAIVALHERPDVAGRPFLVVVPATLKVNWVREIRRIDRAGKILVVDSQPNFGRRAFAGDPNVEVTDGEPGRPEVGAGHRWTVLNYDILDRHMPALVGVRWGALVCDEAHYLMSETSQRTRHVYRLCGFRTNWEEKVYQEVEVTDKKTGLTRTVKRQPIDPKTGKKAVRKWTEPGHPFPPKVRYLLTGTPMTSRPRDLFPLLKIVRHPLGASFWQYAQDFCGATHTGYGWDFTGCTFERLPELVRKVSTQLLQRFKDDCLDLPGKDRDWINLDKEEELARYRDLEALLRREAARQKDIRRFAKAVEDFDEAHRDDASERLPTLADLKRAYRDAESLTIDLISRMRHELALAKIGDTTALVETILEGREKVVVFTNYTKVREALCKKFGQKAVTIHGGVTGEKRQEAVDRFQNDPGVRVMVANLRAGGVGITLTAGTQVVMNDLDWTPANHLQGEDRCYRIGQKAKVQVHYLVVLGTIDEHVAEIYKTKLKIIRSMESGNREEAAVAGRAIEKLLAAA